MPMQLHYKKLTNQDTKWSSLLYPTYAISNLSRLKTHYQAYVSDFQGIEGLLTDPQIMMNPALGVDLFGEGLNVEKAFCDFPDQHICNKYCQWFHTRRIYQTRR